MLKKNFVQTINLNIILCHNHRKIGWCQWILAADILCKCMNHVTGILVERSFNITTLLFYIISVHTKTIKKMEKFSLEYLYLTTSWKLLCFSTYQQKNFFLFLFGLVALVGMTKVKDLKKILRRNMYTNKPLKWTLMVMKNRRRGKFDASSKAKGKTMSNEK